jgi:putative ABC transport system substrate-binding protein
VCLDQASGDSSSGLGDHENGRRGRSCFRSRAPLTCGIALLLATLALGTLSAPLAAAQTTGKVPRIGVLSSVSAAFASPYIEVGRQALRDLGYVDRQNIVIEYRFAEGWDPNRLLELATELVRLKPDAIVVVGDRAVYAAQQATNTIPIIMVSAGDPVRSGFVSSLARPGGNITGLSSLLPEINAKELALLKEALPKASRMAVLWNPKSSGGVLGLKAMQVAAQQLGIGLQSLEVQAPEEFERAFVTMVQVGASAYVVLTDPLTFSRRAEILALATKHRLPGMYEVKEFVDEGGLMSYGPSLRDLIRRAPIYLEKILKGQKPADIPVEQPTKFELVINLKTAKALGLTIPQSVLIQTDQVIQ